MLTIHSIAPAKPNEQFCRGDHFVLNCRTYAQSAAWVQSGAVLRLIEITPDDTYIFETTDGSEMRVDAPSAWVDEFMTHKASARQFCVELTCCGMMSGDATINVNAVNPDEARGLAERDARAGGVVWSTHDFDPDEDTIASKIVE